MEKITFCISNGRNEKDHIKLLFKSLDKNLSTKDHEIIVFVDSDNQNTTEFLITQKKLFPNLKIIKNPLSMAVGMQSNLNYMFEIAKNDIVSNLQSDMVICKNYDVHIQELLNNNTIISATRIEPLLHPPGTEKVSHDLGTDPNYFDFEEFDIVVNKNKNPDKIGNYFFAPFTLHKQRWLEIGGHDTIFRRSREDSDVIWRLLLNGNNVKQTWNSFVYHFTCTSSRGPQWWKNEENTKKRLEIQKQADEIELRKFLRKWKIFKHPSTIDEAIHHKYQIGVNISNVDKIHSQTILQMFYLFDKIYVNNHDVYDFIEKVYPAIHLPANTLLHADDETWNKYKTIFRLENSDDIFTKTKIENMDVVLSFDMTKFIDNSELRESIVHMNDILHDSLTDGDSGDFEVNGVTVNVNSLKNRIKENIHVKNPSLESVNLIEL
jgi:hypothetical protein